MVLKLGGKGVGFLVGLWDKGNSAMAMANIGNRVILGPNVRSGLVAIFIQIFLSLREAWHPRGFRFLMPVSINHQYSGWFNFHHTLST